MSKNTKKSRGVSSAEQPSDASVASPAEEAGVANAVLRVKPSLTYSGARSAWYAALLQHDGRSAESFVETCAANPPSMPKSGKPEDPRAWLRFFVRSGVAQVG